MTHILIFIHWFVLVFTFGNVELVTIDNSKSNDFPIEELNNHTLREVFETHNILYDIPSFSIIGNNEYKIVKNGLLLFNNDVVYLNYKQEMDQVSNVRNTPYFEMSLNTDIQYISTSSNYNLNSGVYSYRLVLNSDKSLFRYWGNALLPLPQVYSNLYLINQTSLGISSLTVEQMDDWFNVYQENKQREISETYDYIENELTTNDLIYIVLFALLWGLAIKFVKGVM